MIRMSKVVLILAGLFAFSSYIAFAAANKSDVLNPSATAKTTSGAIPALAKAGPLFSLPCKKSGEMFANYPSSTHELETLKGPFQAGYCDKVAIAQKSVDFKETSCCSGKGLNVIEDSTACKNPAYGPNMKVVGYMIYLSGKKCK